jgi:2-C-methyl-D-erythritol 2,4-cyclodiphosphate synthase
MRIGHGFDAHRFAEGRRLILGGADIPSDRGLEGHSDADVLTHAIIDALLGAAALGDIGQHFPSSDERWRDASSIDMLRVVARMIAGAGFRVSNVDATVVAEAPRLTPHAAAMRAQLADALGIDAASVSVKPKTSDGMGFTGRGEGIAAFAVVLLE